LVDDYTTTFVDINDTIPVLDNDTYPAFCEPAAPVITTPPNAPGASANVNGRNIVYIPAPGFTGRDSVKYTILCSGVNETATVYITVIPYPDNIDDADCFVTVPPSEWGIQEYSRHPNVSTYMPALVGDLDGDGLPEIVIGTDMNRAPAVGYSNHIGRKLKVFKGGDLSDTTVFNTVQPYNPIMPGVVGIARVLRGGVLTGIIVVAEFDFRLRAYSVSGAHLWTSNDFYVNSTSNINTGTSVSFADFNNDGNPEVYCGNRIFNAATGVLLCKGTGNDGFTEHWEQIHNIPLYSTIAADIYGDARLELIAGNQIYEVASDLTSMTVVKTITPPTCIENTSLTVPVDGSTSVIDLDNDGYLDVLVVKRLQSSITFMYVWSPHKDKILAQKLFPQSMYFNMPFMGDIDGDGFPEIVLITATNHFIYAMKYQQGNDLLTNFWSLAHTDNSGMTGITLFDFNQDGISEIVYRDEQFLRIINGSKKSHVTGNDTIPYNLATFSCLSGTGYEYPVVADIDNDGSSEIIISGSPTVGVNGDLIIYKSSTIPWAPARHVWNQYKYNAVNVNNDLTIPRYQMNPATVFPGPDGILGNADDVRPYNAFLQQQTLLSKNGTPLWIASNAKINESSSTFTVSGDDFIINACFTNDGDATLSAPVFVTVYKNSIAAGNIITKDSINVSVAVGSSGCVSVTIPNAAGIADLVSIIVRINDRDNVFPYHVECDITDNEISFINPFAMRKDATLMLTPIFKHNGTYPNPVSVLYNEEIRYDIKAVNAMSSARNLVITDTIPTYLSYVPGSAAGSVGKPVALLTSVDSSKVMVNSVLHDRFVWRFTGVPSSDSVKVYFNATPLDGSAASQPLYINRAWVTIPVSPGDSIYIPTNSTYHQGAGISIMTFSAGFGGNIYNAGEQALDYMTTPSSGIIIAPDEGYTFAGWSHGDYVSLRGATVKARDGIMLYDTLTVYGNVELHANFAPKEYAIAYFLNGGENAGTNPEKYTVKSGTIALESPHKAGDTFVGWTGSNGEKPQAEVVISGGTTGELIFYANYLLSGREDETPVVSDTGDKAWAVDDNLYVRTNKPNSIVRIYSLDGILHQQHIIIVPGIITKKLSRGIYVVTINNNTGRKVVLTD
jgi:conserved repeat domain/Listeria/Bacterioides repeat